MAEFQHILKMMTDLGGVMPMGQLAGVGGLSSVLGLLGAAGGGLGAPLVGLGGLRPTPGIAPIVSPLLTAGLGSQTPPAVAAVQAAIIALKFVTSGLQQHSAYEFTEALPGVTHLQHAIGHVNFFAALTPARAAR
jgi:hypothetical protein